MNHLKIPFLAFVFFAASLVFNHAFSQQFKLGLGGSVHASTHHLADSDQKDTFQPQWSLGYSPGLFTNIMFSDNFSLQTEFYYSWQGRKLTIDNDWHHHARYQYIEVPILLRKTFEVKLFKDVVTTCYINLGPNVKYWTKGKGEIVTPANIPLEYEVVFGNPPENEFPFEYMYLDEVNRLMLGLTAGVGFGIDIFELNTLFMEFRYTYGHTYFGGKDSAKYNVSGFQDTMKSNPRTITFTASYAMEFNYFKLQQQSNLKKHKKAPKPKRK